MDFGIVRWFVAIAGCLLCHVQGFQRDVLTLCNSDLEPINRTAFDINFGGINAVPATGSNEQQCTCRMIAYTRTYLQVHLHLPKPEYNYEGDGIEGFNRRPSDNQNGRRNATCNPFIFLAGEAQAPLAKCSSPRTENASQMTLSIPAGKSIHVTLHNHKQLEIEPNLRFTVASGILGVMCFSAFDSPVWEAETCPCEPVGIVPGGKEVFRTDDASTSQRLIIGLVCTALFILIVLAVIAILWCRKRASGGQKDLEGVDPNNVASENPAFSSSRASGLDRSAGTQEPTTRAPIYSNIGPQDQKIPFDPDPTLNLDLQTAPPKQSKGSTDSGVYSMPADKGMNNNNARYANTPIAPDQMYNPLLNAKQPSTASLTGQGALHGSMDQLDPAALYAKPNKTGRKQVNPNPAPTRSASHDALNKRPNDGDLEQARSRSHNTSMASMGSTVETDV